MNIVKKLMNQSLKQKVDLLPLQEKLPQIGTVIRRTKNFYYVDIGESEPKLCHIRANLFHGNPKTNLVAVGDQVEIDNAHAGETG